MSSKNYEIEFYKQLGGQHLYFWKESHAYHRKGEALDGCIDYYRNHHIWRIEILYLQHELKRGNYAFDAKPVTPETDVAIQIGDETPVSFILWMDQLHHTKTSSHIGVEAWLLVDDANSSVGVEVIIPQ